MAKRKARSKKARDYMASREAFKAHQRRNDIIFITMIISLTIALAGGYFLFKDQLTGGSGSDDGSTSQYITPNNNNDDTGSTSDDSLPWFDYEPGMDKASKEHLPIIIDFYADWCGPCQNMEKDLYTDARFIEKSKEFVLIKVNGDYRQDLMTQYNVNSYPTVVFMDRNQNEDSRWNGWGYEVEKQINEFLEYMDSVL